jgi:hypothetical protein
VQLDDAAIAAKVESTLQQGTDVDADKLEVTVADGVVQLRGEVRSRDVIDELEARAQQVSEVRRLESLLRVRQPPGYRRRRQACAATRSPAPMGSRRKPRGPGQGIKRGAVPAGGHPAPLRARRRRR